MVKFILFISLKKYVHSCTGAQRTWIYFEIEIYINIRLKI